MPKEQVPGRRTANIKLALCEHWKMCMRLPSPPAPRRHAGAHVSQHQSTSSEALEHPQFLHLKSVVKDRRRCFREVE